MNKVSKREKILLIILVDLILVMGFFFFILKPTMALNLETAEERAGKIGEYTELINEDIQYQKNLARIKEQQQELHVAGDNVLPYAKTVVLHLFFNALATEYGLHIKNISLNEAEGKNQLLKTTTISLSLNGTYGNLIGLLKKLESYEMTIEVPSLEINSPNALTYESGRNHAAIDANLKLYFHMAPLENETGFFDSYKN